MTDIIEKVAKCLVEAASTFRADQKDAYREAIAKESNARGCWVMQQILENALVAESQRSPLCDDTGIPHIFIELGRERILSGKMIGEIFDGVREGLRRLPGRPMAIKGNDQQRIDQSGGLDSESGAVLPAPPIIKLVDGRNMRLTVLMLGGGPAIRGVTQRVFHRHSVEAVIEEIVGRAIPAVSQLGCSPCTLAIGIGRSQYEATSLMMEAMALGDYGIQSDFEREITKRVNKSEIGALGLGGKTSVLATFMKVGPQRASGVRIVAIRPCCCFEPRRATIEL